MSKSKQYKFIEFNNRWYMGKYNKNNIINLGTDYYFLKFSVKNCISNSESTFSWKPTCKSAE